MAAWLLRLKPEPAKQPSPLKRAQLRRQKVWSHTSDIELATFLFHIGSTSHRMPARMDPNDKSMFRRLRNLVIGGARKPTEPSIYHKLSLIALFAWIGLGADGLSSACYGPPEAFATLGAHKFLGIFVALATALTIFIISSSYSQIIELFPAGGGGYVVASKLLSPKLGMIAGCALMVDYVLTITVSIAAGVAALYSLPFVPEYLKTMQVLGAPLQLWTAMGVIGILMVMNLRGVRESVEPLVPIFLIFVLTHAFIIVYAVGQHLWDVGAVTAKASVEFQSDYKSLGLFGMIFLIMHAYGMGAGTYTGIEAVSNGLPLLREPRVQTGKRVMTYMWVSLAVSVVGLMLAYLLYDINNQPGKTLNAVLLETATHQWWQPLGWAFVTVTLISEAALLTVAGQTGFLGGPRILAYMALDRWLPSRLSALSDRLVTHNGVMLMAGAAMITMWATQGDVRYLVVLYSINVFITFLLSQTGMVRHWWQNRREGGPWRKGLFINGTGMVLTAFILVWLTAMKFSEGGWVTLVVTSSLICLVLGVNRHYRRVSPLMQRLNKLTEMTVQTSKQLDKTPGGAAPLYDPQGGTAVLLVNGFNGFGMHTLLNVLRFFHGSFRNFVFVQVGLVDAGNFKGIDEIDNLRRFVDGHVQKYIDFVRGHGYYAEAVTQIGTDVADEVMEAAPRIVAKYPNAVFFAGQLVFPNDTWVNRIFHNYITFAVQRRLYREGIPFVILPIRV